MFAFSALVGFESLFKGRGEDFGWLLLCTRLFIYRGRGGWQQGRAERCQRGPAACAGTLGLAAPWASSPGVE